MKNKILIQNKTSHDMQDVLKYLAGDTTNLH